MPSKLTQADFDAQITAEDLVKQQKLLENMPEEMQKHLRKGVNQADATMKSGLVARMKRFTGATASSIGSRVKVNGIGSMTGITGPSDKGSKARAHIFRFMQDGSYFQNDRNTQPWVYNLTEWVRSKWGTTTDEETKRAAFGLAVSIKQKGIKGTPIARPVMNERKDKALGFIKAAIDTIVEKLRVK